ncbi:hypothetical protein QR680_019255 [Steinernema hermaphroditum]|uniref:Uncharacterized protein n=1 Tax=Steinernema hermaphroditum TaxID=289476 RepID=A0AA39HKG4_9BILA|nr:hypothetical protein QR680_019255 [Steinernema hermaphroditum]
METAKPEAVRPLPIRNRALVAWSSAAQLLPRRDVLVHLGGPVLPVGDRLAAHHLAAVTTVAVLALALFRLHVAIMIAEAARLASVAALRMAVAASEVVVMEMAARTPTHAAA